jgi:hypothetical protein
MGCNLEGVVRRSGRLNQHMQGQMPSRCRQERLLGPNNIAYGLDLGHHDVAQVVTGLTRHHRHVRLKRRVVDGVHTHGHTRPATRISIRLTSELDDHGSVLGLATRRRSVLAVQRDVEHASTEFLKHVSLQLQAFAHSRLHAAVVVTHRQKAGYRLGAKKNIARM